MGEILTLGLGPEQTTKPTYRSHFIPIVNALPSDLQAPIWQKAVTEMARLDATTPGIKSHPTPAERLTIAQEATNGTSPSKLRDQFQLGRSRGYCMHILTAQRDADTVLADALWKRGLIQTSDIPDEIISSPKFINLQRLHRESDLIRNILGQPKIQRLLEKTPHLEALLRSYQQYSTLEPFLSELGVPFHPKDLKNINRQAHNFLFGSNNDTILMSLLTRCLFAKWVNQGTNWYGIGDDELDYTFSQAIELAYTHPPRAHTKPQLRYREFGSALRAFFRDILEQEFTVEMRRTTFHDPEELQRLFIPKNGTIASFDDVDVKETYMQYANHFTRPPELVGFASRFLGSNNKGKAIRELSEQQGPLYPNKTKTRWSWAGVTFLTNVLLRRTNALITWETLSANTGSRLRRVRKAIQETTRPDP